MKRPKRTVLVVDDYPNAAELICDMAREAGFACEAAASDRAAYAALRKSALYSALVVDVNLGPGTTGYDVARFARQIDPGLPVIFVSGEVGSDSLRAFGVPGSTFLEKPLTEPQLAVALRRATGET